MSNIRVAVRVRPLLRKELDQAACSIVSVRDSTVTLENVNVRSSLLGQLGSSADDSSSSSPGNFNFGDSRERLRTFTYDFVYPGDDVSSPRYVHQVQVRLPYVCIPCCCLRFSVRGCACFSPLVRPSTIAVKRGHKLQNVCKDIACQTRCVLKLLSLPPSCASLLLRVHLG